MVSVRKRRDSVREAVVDEMRAMLAGSTAHAIGRIVTAKKRSIRVMWAFFCGLATIGFTYHFSKITNYYFSYPISTSVAYKSVRFQFPDVTICNMVPISLHKLEKKDPNLELFMSLNGHESEAEAREKLLENTQNDKYSMILRCTYNQQSCGADNFTEIRDPTFRSCFTFSPQQEVRANSPEYGLNLIVFAENKHSHPIPDISFAVHENWEASGIRLVIHERNTHPHPELKGVNVQTGVNVRFAVTMERFKLYNIARDGESRCDHEQLELSYCLIGTNITTRKFMESSEDCYTNQIQKLAISRCNCFSPDHDVPSELCDTYTGMEICHAGSYECYENLISDLTADFENLVVRKCKPTCYQTAYSKQMSSSDWPSHIAEKRILNIVRARHNELVEAGHESALSEVVDATEAELEEYNLIKDNFLKVCIYPETLNGDEIVEELAYPFASYISEVGGILGLWMGASILTFLEPVQLIMHLLMLIPSSCKRNHKNDKLSQHSCAVDLRGESWSAEKVGRDSL